VAIHVAWVGLNAGIWKFDPYPFALLCMLVSLDGVLLSTFVLIKQNRMSERADHRRHLDLQINLLAEKEVTKVLQLQHLICRRLGIEEAETDREIAELSDVTATENLARQLQEKIPDKPGDPKLCSDLSKHVLSLPPYAIVLNVGDNLRR
jgi:uncharacterized membrane protein